MKLIGTIVIKLLKDGYFSVAIAGRHLGDYPNLADAEQAIHKYIMNYFS